MVQQVLGKSIARREDADFLSGEAKFTADITLPGMLHMAILHSDYAHAMINNIDLSEARQMPGIVDIITGADTAEIMPLPCIMNPAGDEAHFPPHPYGLPGAQTVLATDRVRYIGEFVAVVVAKTRQQAYEALPKIRVDYEPLAVVTNAEDALNADSVQLHETVPNNLNQYVSHGDEAAALAAIASSEVVVKQRLRNQRVTHNAIETRATIGDYNAETQNYTLWTNTQIPHGNRFLLSQLVMGIPYNKLRVIAPHIGGAFGSKGYLYPDTAIALFLAKRLGHPVKWVDTRRGLAHSTVQARDQIQYVTIAGTPAGEITALHCTCYANLGAYPATNGPGAPAVLTGCSITGAYAIAHPFYEVHCAFTNLVPTGPMRGAGRAEAIYLIERMIDLYAQEIGKDPTEVRRLNLVPADSFPYPNGLGWTYDTGNYETALDQALAKIDYANMAEQKAAAKSRGKRLGVGLGTYVAIAGVGPSGVMAREIGLNGSTWGSAHLRVHPTGEVSVITGSQPHGQGHVTVFSQIIGEHLGIDMEQVEVLHSDTKGAIYAQGSYGSRTYSVEGATIYQATQKINQKARKMAAHLFQVPEEEISQEPGKFFVKGQPDTVKTLKDIALALWYAWDLPEGMEPGLEVITFFDPPDFNYPFGTHIALVEIDEVTSEVELVRYVAVDDFGNVGNPMIVDGQTHGNIHLGISQALAEETVYHEDGQLVSNEFSNYAMTKASQLPAFELARTVTPTPHNPLGAKGAGDVSNPAAAPAVVNAICDALKDLGITHLDMPVTAEKIWRAKQTAQSHSAGISPNISPNISPGGHR